MLKSIQQRDLERNRWVKIGMSVLLGVICLSMLTYLIPGMGSAAFTNSPDAVATVGGQSITATDVQRQLNTALHGQSVPDVLKGLYAKQVLDQMILKQALTLEAQRLGVRVTDQELQLTRLVSAECQTGKVVALHQNPRANVRTAERRPQIT